MKFRIKSAETTILIVAIYQILGGIWGFGLIAWLLLQTQELNGPILLIYLISIALYCLSANAGLVLLRKDYKRGLILSFINQAFQVVAIAIGGYKFDFISGAKLAGGFNFTNGFFMNLNFALTSEFNMSWNSGSTFYLYINFLAVFLIYVIADLYDDFAKKKTNAEEINQLVINDDVNVEEDKETNN